MTACLLGLHRPRRVQGGPVAGRFEVHRRDGKELGAGVRPGAARRLESCCSTKADALFGKRTETHDAHDRYADQEIAFLLQRIETFDGIAILASNLRDNIDDSFARRFESIIYFPLPRPEGRERLWRQGFSPKATLETDLNLNGIAHDYPLSGGPIMNAIRVASLRALTEKGRPIGRDDVVGAIRRELAKEGRAG